MDLEQCNSCGEMSVVVDVITGMLVCDQCGVVKEEMNLSGSGLQTDEGSIYMGTFVSQNDTGVMAATLALNGTGGHRKRAWQHVSHGFVDKSAKRKMAVIKKVNDISSMLRLSNEKANEVKHMVRVMTNDNWTTGRPIDILIGACIYIVARQSHIPLTLVDVSDAVNCVVRDVARMYQKVLKTMDLVIPDLDVATFLERGVSTFPAFQKLEKEMLKKLLKEGQMLLDYASQWCILTGRHPLGVVAAVLALIAQLNKIESTHEDFAKLLNIHPLTARLRFKEMEEALMGFARSLPWGKDINGKTYKRHLPGIIKHLEIRTKLQGKIINPRNELRLITVPVSKEIANKHLKSLEQQQSQRHTLPPSFRTNESSRLRRCLKIQAAKQRVNMMRQGIAKELLIQLSKKGLENTTNKNRLLLLSQSNRHGNLEWEDLVIEYLIIHHADEKLIEEGYYNVLLSRSPLETNECHDDVEQYIRSEEEVEFLKSLEDEASVPWLSVRKLLTARLSCDNK